MQGKHPNRCSITPVISSYFEDTKYFFITEKISKNQNYKCAGDTPPRELNKNFFSPDLRLISFCRPHHCYFLSPLDYFLSLGDRDSQTRVQNRLGGSPDDTRPDSVGWTQLHGSTVWTRATLMVFRRPAGTRDQIQTPQRQAHTSPPSPLDSYLNFHVVKQKVRRRPSGF